MASPLPRGGNRATISRGHVAVTGVSGSFQSRIESNCQACRVYPTTSLVPHPNHLRIPFEKHHEPEPISNPIGGLNLSLTIASSSDGKGAEGRMPLMIHCSRNRCDPSAPYRHPHTAITYDHENRRPNPRCLSGERPQKRARSQIGPTSEGCNADALSDSRR